MKTLDYIKLSQ